MEDEEEDKDFEEEVEDDIEEAADDSEEEAEEEEEVIILSLMSCVCQCFSRLANKHEKCQLRLTCRAALMEEVVLILQYWPLDIPPSSSMQKS